MNEPCPFPCTNKTEFGYCKTTACLYAPTIRLTSMPQQNYGEAAQVKTDVDIEPVKHAYWVKRMEHGVGKGYEAYTPIWSCSNCGRDYDPASCSIIKYCYICGAKMDGGQEEK